MTSTDKLEKPKKQDIQKEKNEKNSTTIPIVIQKGNTNINNNVNSTLPRVSNNIHRQIPVVNNLNTTSSLRQWILENN